ncbi:nuclear transport factor 2 family protein [Kitasatospora sp. NBC_00240]|uniref:nuclear transport factor 2 family protein n=1 Tax=Kitasatospora sp. NBC_00240 TaxID=2903567 RepID=UPI00224E692E|nr:nuclear transport factor 2 family protein [Kitasatospora sp. NBC_00240]MCX5207725.1 nuclear transport factor 2 family protein [Kitasatospora sp. NBC_00240]MCX5216063.1 nuclear transport factor 2 family protein [Kitasatospora sp. NBC_00240]
MSRLPRAMTTLIAAAALSAVPATTAYAAQDAHRRPPRTVADWACAWNGTDPRALGALFTVDGVYTDLGVGVTFHGRQEISGWKARADSLIDNVHVIVRTARRDGWRITVEAFYAGHLKGAPKSFAVPMTTLLDVDGHGRISSDQDHYSLATVLAQSGLPADWTPPTH